MRVPLIALALMGCWASAYDVEIGSNDFPYNAPLCAN